MSGGNRNRHWHRWKPCNNDTKTIKQCACGATRRWTGKRWSVQKPITNMEAYRKETGDERLPTGPSVKRGRSRQDYETPPEFMRAIHNRFGVPSWDLAATEQNKKAENFIGLPTDSLTVCWSQLAGLLYLNPQFDDIRPWAEKCFVESHHGAKILFLVPASTGSTWFAHFVFNKAVVHFLSGKNYRIKFVGADDLYPKDLMLVEYDKLKMPGFGLWPWRSYA